MTTDEQIDILEAYKDGKIIEIWMGNLTDSNVWGKFLGCTMGDEKPDFNFMHYKYRIKPE